MRPGISLCVMAKDEEENLPRCLERTRNLVDEILVCDTGSTDKTIEIAETFGARVVRHDWHQDFAEIRNFMLGLVEHDYVLVLDADESFSIRDHEAFRSEASAAMASRKAVLFPERNYTNRVSVGWVQNAGEYPEDEVLTGWFVTPSVRLMPRTTRYEGEIHENPMVDPTMVVRSKIPLHHWAQVNPERQAKKGWYWGAALKKIASQGDGFEIRREMGAQAVRDGNFKLALDNWTRAAAFNPRDCVARVNMASCLVKVGRYRAALVQAMAAARLDPRSLDAAYNLAWCKLLTGKADEATILCGAMLKMNDKHKPAQILHAICRACGHGDREPIRWLHEHYSHVPETLGPIVDELRRARQVDYAYSLARVVADLSA